MGSNVLEALILPLTSREINDGRFKSFISQLRPIKTSNLSFVIIVNNRTHISISEDLKALDSKFKSVDLIHLNIPTSDDIYSTNSKWTPKYGWASGPNILFLSAMRHCTKFNTVLLIETDCIVKPTFLEDLALFTCFSGGFLIAGTRYDGNTYMDANTLLFHHINGVALYNTGNPRFQTLINNLDAYIVEEVKSTPFFAYDVAIIQLVLTRILDTSTHSEWKRIYKDIITTNFIVNMSIPSDKSISMSHINKHYPHHVILHKK
uniref:Uncharacterized protein n=1 Tax=viral metagenome TaxID=1070528 RepID=A0A6C0I6R4_9ZZZZ